MRIEQILRDEIQESRMWIDKAEGVYVLDLAKRVELQLDFRKHERS